MSSAPGGRGSAGPAPAWWRRLPLVGRQDGLGQFVRTVLVGAFNTVLSHGVISLCQFVLFLPLPPSLRTDASVATTFVVVLVFSFAVNRRWSFDLGSGRGTLYEFGTFTGANSLSLVVPMVGWNVVEAAAGELGLVAFNIVNFALQASVFPLKFVIYRWVVFRRALRER